ncbi:hypothetical protein HMN09_00834100 [Mycena chlorophos]|uniref:BTB domain-containing protein n=1 Tax=Mycena chlorophos TaxID=658473 RepID=A0A8H6W7B2_MYCCL|nr:hypothetical protein HMN09_00834100 [Mycena chlorophos]
MSTSSRSTAGMVVNLRDSIGDVPPPLIGASTTMFGSKIILFGGCTPTSHTVVADLYILDVELCKWEKVPTPSDASSVLKGRCFHTADIWQNHLVVFGGLAVMASNSSGNQSTSKSKNPSPRAQRLQDLGDVRLFDLSTFQWLPPNPIAASTTGASGPAVPSPPARHNHISCISRNHLIVFGGVDGWGEPLSDICVFDLENRAWVHAQHYPSESPRLDVDRAFCATSRWRVSVPEWEHKSEFLVPLPYSEAVCPGEPAAVDVYLFNSSQSTIDVLDVSCKDNEINTASSRSTIGHRQPTASHKPTGVVLGTTLILAGNSPPPAIGRASSVFSIWTLDLTNRNNVWTHIDTGGLMGGGSWSHAHLWTPHNKFLVLGKPANTAVQSPLASPTYEIQPNHWRTVASIDLEALGIYQAPARSLDPVQQQRALAVLAQSRHADFVFACEDGREIPCARIVVAGRWGWLHEQLESLRNNPNGGSELTSGKHISITVSSTKCTIGASYPVVAALLQYFYALSLGTALQRAPAVLSHLLLIATEFRISYLQALVKHAMHLALSESTAAGVYEVAALCGCRSLQIRAFAMHTQRWMKAGRARSHSEGTRPRLTPLLVPRGSSESGAEQLVQSQKHARSASTVTKVRRLPSPQMTATAAPAPLSPVLLSPTFLKTPLSPLQPVVEFIPPVPRLPSPVVAKTELAIASPPKRAPTPTSTKSGLPTRKASPAPAVPAVPNRPKTPTPPSTVRGPTTNLNRPTTPGLRPPTPKRPKIPSPPSPDVGKPNQSKAAVSPTPTRLGRPTLPRSPGSESQLQANTKSQVQRARSRSQSSAGSSSGSNSGSRIPRAPSRQGTNGQRSRSTTPTYKPKRPAPVPPPLKTDVPPASTSPASPTPIASRTRSGQIAAILGPRLPMYRRATVSPITPRAAPL